MNFVEKIYFTFSQYANQKERNVGHFFKSLHEKNDKTKTTRQLIKLLQEDIICFNLFSEYKYKGYRYLSSNSKRRELYLNASLLVSDFKKFEIRESIEEIKIRLLGLGYNLNFSQEQQDRLIYLYKIMQYLNPKRGLYIYRESSSFGQLLKNPTQQKLIGDCNQIVTLYIYLYSLKYDIQDLQLITPPNHVALYYLGIQIEATSASFIKPENDQDILPIQEIAPINLLDVTDSYFKTHKLSENNLLQATRLSYLISSNREIVQKNLKVSYRNSIIELVNSQSYRKALLLAKQIKDSQLLDYVVSRAINFYLSKKRFSEARRYAANSINSKDLNKQILSIEANDLYSRQEYEKALKIFDQLNNSVMVQNCYINLFSFEAKKLKGLKTVVDIKKNNIIIKKLHFYALKSNDEKLIKYTKNLAKHL